MFRRRIESVRSLIVLLPMALSGCGLNTTADPPTAAKTFSGEHPVRVVTTTGPVTDILRNVGGQHLQVSGLMGPGVDPHLYRAVPSDIERLSAADMIFYNGLHLEGRMADLFEKLAKRKPTFAVTHSLVEAADPRLRKPPEFEGYYDPHVWHHPVMWAECVKYVIGVLSEFDPEHREDYARNGEAYLERIAEADKYCRDELSTIPKAERVLVTAHDAFGYYCLAYDLKPMALKGVSTEEEVSIGRMDEVINYLVEHKIKAVFVESAVAPQIVRALIEPCREKGQEVKIGGELYADALGPEGSGADNYLGMIKANVDTIVSALK